MAYSPSWLALIFLGISIGSCSDDNLPTAPAKCQEPFALLTPWWGGAGFSPEDQCATPGLLAGGLQAQAGTVYYGTMSSLCAVDASGIRTVGSTVGTDGLLWGFIEAFWVDSDRILFTDGHGLYAVPTAGGERTTLLDLPFIFQGLYAYDGSYLYWASSYNDDTNTIYRAAIAGGGPEALTTAPGHFMSRIQVSGERLDFTSGDAATGIGPLVRMQLSSSTAVTIDVSASGALLASVGDYSYVRYATAPVLSDDGDFGFGVIGSDGKIAPAWTGNVPQFFPMVSTVYGTRLFSGGRLHYHGGAKFLGVNELTVGANQGTVLGCSPTSQNPEMEWAAIYGIAADDNYVYAIVSRTSKVAETEHAIARFARP